MRIKSFFIVPLLALLCVVLMAPRGAVVAAGEVRTIVAMGDSLTAGYQLPPGKGFPAQLEKALEARNMDIRMVDAGVSGDTSTGGRSRLEWTLAGLDGAPDLVIVEFGGNDALRGIEPALTRANIDAMLTTLADNGIPALLVGMRAPPNMGSEYEAEFNGLFPELADKHGVAFYPFFLDGVALNPELKLDDGLHPNVQGVEVMVERMLPLVLKTLADAAGES